MSQPGRRGLYATFLADAGRRIEPPNGVMRLIIAYKSVSAVLLLLLALFLLGLIVNRSWDERVREAVLLMGLHADNRFLRTSLYTFGLLGRRSTTALGLISLFYAALETTEVLGLLDRRRWAEYLVLVATLLFLPYEALELAWRASGSKALIFVVNLAIAWYLIKAKRLFQAPEPTAEEPVAGDTVTPLRGEP